MTPRARSSPRSPPTPARPTASTTCPPSSSTRAIRGEGLRTAFQPIVDLHRLEVTGYEALARFDIPGIAGPEQVIIAAGERGVLAELEARCLRSALQARPHLPPNCFLTVNVEPDSVGASAVAAVLDAEPHLRGVSGGRSSPSTTRGPATRGCRRSCPCAPTS